LGNPGTVTVQSIPDPYEPPSILLFPQFGVIRVSLSDGDWNFLRGQIRHGNGELRTPEADHHNMQEWTHRINLSVVPVSD
jgi:hypothetical protein